MENISLPLHILSSEIMPETPLHTKSDTPEDYQTQYENQKSQ